MRFPIVFFLMLSITAPMYGQYLIENEEQAAFQRAEDKLNSWGDKMQTAKTDDEKREALGSYIPFLIEQLKKTNSYYYPFDSLRYISIMDAPDTSFRIFTWQLTWSDFTTQHYGAIQMRGEDLELYPLLDWSDTMNYHCDYILSPKTWFGALYYDITHHIIDGEDYYFLFGFDGNDMWSSRKIIEVMHFVNDKPKFGAPLFSVPEASNLSTNKNRFFLEFKSTANVRLGYDPELGMIVFDHVAPFESKYKGLYFAYIPDGTYEGLKLNDDGIWEWVPKIFHFSLDANDNPPVPSPRFSKD